MIGKTGSLSSPSKAVDGYVTSPYTESRLWRDTMKVCHGEDWYQELTGKPMPAGAAPKSAAANPCRIKFILLRRVHRGPVQRRMEIVNLGILRNLDPPVHCWLE